MRWRSLANSILQIADSKSQTANGKLPIAYEEPSAISHQPTAIRCPLCGKKFQAGEASKCASCTLAVKCGMVMCPNCSYEFTS